MLKSKQKQNPTQTYINGLIRERDVSSGYYKCCSCNYITTEADAGHYIAVGVSSYLRYFPLNIHAQCRSCNRFGGGGRVTGYGVFMVRKYGRVFLEVLDDFKFGIRGWRGWSNNELKYMRKLTLNEIINKYYDVVMTYWKGVDQEGYTRYIKLYD